MSIGKSRDGRQSPYQLDFRAPPRPNSSMNGSSMVSVGSGHADEHDGAGEVAGLERLAVHRGVADRLDAHVGAEAAGDRAGRTRRDPWSWSCTCAWRRTPSPTRACGRRCRRRRSSTPRRAREPAIAASPTPPQPNTATVLPRVTSPVLSAAPSPAITPQPSSPAAVAGAAGSTFVHCPAATSVFSTKAPMPSAGDSSVPSVSVIFWVALWVSKQYHGSPRQARPALPAHGPPVEDDVVAGGHLGDAGADGLDDAGGLVAEQERELVVDAALAVVQVGVAHPARLDRDDGLARVRGRG